MFTGIIEDVGHIEHLAKTGDIMSITISSKKIASKLAEGDSISIDGACFTVTATAENSFSVEAINETLKRTIAGDYEKNSHVNLETSLTLEKGISGHLVQGHVDTQAKIISLSEENELEIELPHPLRRFIAFKGSITVNGVSLTVSKLSDKSFTVSLVPFTLENTNLGELTENKEVNLEIDLIARYLERMLEEKDSHTNYNFLKERNLI